MVPKGMTSQVHEFDAREGGSFRISLTYDTPTGTGKTSAHTDTYHGRFVKLVPDEQVVEVMEFETADPALRGEMTITISLAAALLLSLVSVIYTAKNMEFLTGRDDLMPKNTGFHRDYRAWRQEFGDPEDIVVVIEGDEAEKRPRVVPALQRARGRLGSGRSPDARGAPGGRQLQLPAGGRKLSSTGKREMLREVGW